MINNFLSSESGVSLLEMVLALAILGITITGLLFGVSTSVLGEKVIEDINAASNLARSQLEHTLAQSFTEPPVYPTITAPAGYSLSLSSYSVVPALLQEILVAVSNTEKELVTLKTYKMNSSYVAGPPALFLSQRDFRWYQNVNDRNPITPMAVENNNITATAPNQVYRLRMNLSVSGLPMPLTTQSFKLQYSSDVAGPWSDVGSIGSSEIWRGYDNSIPADGVTITIIVLSTSNVMESYEEQNPSAANPNALAVGQFGEWDWVIQENNATPNTAYYFRMAKSDGTALDSYARIISITTAPPIAFTQRDYRWYANVDSVTPVTALAAENAATASTAFYFRMVRPDSSALESYVNYPQITTPLNTIAQDDFESGDEQGGTGWSGVWTLTGAADVTGISAPYQGDFHLRLRSSTGYAARSVNLSGKTTVKLLFWQKANAFEPGDTATLSISSDGSSWTVLKTWVDGEDDNIYRFWDFDLSSYSLNSNFWIAFDANMSGVGDRIFFDWIKIIGQ